MRGTRVGILETHRRPLGGVFATVMDYFWREDSPWLVLQLPDGRRVVAPVAWTDLTAGTFPATANQALLLAPALPPMARLWQRLRPKRSTKRRSPS